MDQAFSLGLDNSLNPCALATVLIFLILISRITLSKANNFLFGISFIIAVALTNGAMIFGMLDLVLTHPVAIQTLRMIYLLIAALFISIGLLNFRDWMALKKSQSVENNFIRLPNVLNRIVQGLGRFLSNSKRKKVFTKIFIVLIAFILGEAATIFASIGSKDYNSFVLFYQTAREGNVPEAIKSVIIFILLAIIPLLVVWAIFLSSGIEKINFHVAKGAVFILKISVSAVYLSVGIGLGLMFLM